MQWHTAPQIMQVQSHKPVLLLLHFWTTFQWCWSLLKSVSWSIHTYFSISQISHIVCFKLGHQANFQVEALSVSALKLNVYNYEIYEDPVYIKSSVWYYHSTFLGTFNFQMQSYYFRGGMSCFLTWLWIGNDLKHTEWEWHPMYTIASNIQAYRGYNDHLRSCNVVFPSYTSLKVKQTDSHITTELNCVTSVRLIQIIWSIYVRLWTRDITQGWECRMWCVDIVNRLRIISYLNKINTFFSTISQPSASTRATVNLGWFVGITPPADRDINVMASKRQLNPF